MNSYWVRFTCPIADEEGDKLDDKSPAITAFFNLITANLIRDVSCTNVATIMGDGQIMLSAVFEGQTAEKAIARASASFDRAISDAGGALDPEDLDELNWLARQLQRDLDAGLDVKVRQLEDAA